MEEIFDVVNDNDEVVAQASREECHSNPNLIHRTVHFTLIDKKNKLILLTQRSFKKSNDAGKLCFLGEHMLTGESYKEGLIRGAKEELEIDINIFEEATHNIFRYDTQTEFVRFFLVEWDMNKEIKFDPHEFEGINWVNLEELKNNENISDMTKYWIQNIEWRNFLS